MVKINLLPKKPRKESLRRLTDGYKAACKLEVFHAERIIKLQEDLIGIQKIIMKLNGINL